MKTFSPEPSLTKPRESRAIPLDVAVGDRLDLDELGVQVVAGGLGDRRHRVGRDPPPGGDADVDAALGLLAQVFAPGPAGDEDLDRVLQGLTPTVLPKPRKMIGRM